MDDRPIEEKQKIFDEQVDKAVAQLKSTHDKKEYTFSNLEKRRLAQQDLIEKFASQALEDIINVEVLPRIGVDTNPQVFTFYDIGLGRLIVFTPKAKKV